METLIYSNLKTGLTLIPDSEIGDIEVLDFDSFEDADCYLSRTTIPFETIISVSTETAALLDQAYGIN